MARSKTCLLALAVVLALQGAIAQRASDILGNLPPTGDSLTLAHYFPEHSAKQIPAGDVISVVVSGRNTGSKALNLSAIVGSINSPQNYEMFIQNFTIARYFAPLAPGAEASVEYKFRADPILGSTPPREWTLALHALYEVDGAYFANTFFNATVDIAEAPRLVDPDLIWLAVTMIALIAGAAYLAYTLLADKLGLNKGKAKKAKRVDGPVALDEDEWIKGTHYDVAKRRRAAAKRA
ncbi:hypothetical protein Rsub_11941 [Raphidocelis subcapitata]|uniref:Translocon-associated protein subunit alpha n=1 Tax=Raphidocelis subcapitata TaxID=307507 RepID=A0A2V0PQG8_9CHLO|nr:hypothetical protein Rsub_11941 [Raphidocelis subcapitata]|eukprot:GBF99455.1 hypothetical protein Rsub_11941 [Raphidocelis subcapitata]